MRKKSHTVLNRMSLWQYALLLLMLVTFAFYSLPTFFGEQPSLGLHGQTRLSGARQRLLQKGRYGLAALYRLGPPQVGQATCFEAGKGVVSLVMERPPQAHRVSSNEASS